MQSSWTKGTWLNIAVILLSTQILSGCYFFNFFKKKSSGANDESDVYSGTVIGQSLGAKAGGPDEAALAAIRAITTENSPAAIRPGYFRGYSSQAIINIGNRYVLHLG